LENLSSQWNEVVKSAGQTVDMMKSLTDFQIGEMKFPETKIGETITKAEDWLGKKVEQLEIKPQPKVPPVPAAPAEPPKIPLPPPIRPRMHIRRGEK
jgi:hypothetical protein